jgi:hypothetical protein
VRSPDDKRHSCQAVTGANGARHETNDAPRIVVSNET